MKNLIIICRKRLLIAFLLFSFAGTVYAIEGQPSPLRENSLSFSLTDCINHYFSLGYERNLNRKWSLKLMGGYRNNEYSARYMKGVRGARIELQPRYYFNAKGNESGGTGLFSAPFLQWQQVISKGGSAVGLASDGHPLYSYGAGMVLGFRTISKHGFYLDACAGAGLYDVSRRVGVNYLFDNYKRGWGFNGGISCGFSF